MKEVYPIRPRYRFLFLCRCCVPVCSAFAFSLISCNYLHPVATPRPYLPRHAVDGQLRVQRRNGRSKFHLRRVASRSRRRKLLAEWWKGDGAIIHRQLKLPRLLYGRVCVLLKWLAFLFCCSFCTNDSTKSLFVISKEIRQKCFSLNRSLTRSPNRLDI